MDTILKGLPEPETTYDEETGLQYLCLMNDYRRFNDMVLHRYEQLTRGQRELVGSIVYLYKSFLKDDRVEPLRGALDDFFRLTLIGSLRAQLLQLDQYVNIITWSEWCLSAKLGESTLPEKVKSIHFNCSYTSGGRNWEMDPGLAITIHVQCKASVEKLQLFVMEEERIVYGPQLTPFMRIEKDFDVRKTIFQYVNKMLRA